MSAATQHGEGTISATYERMDKSMLTHILMSFSPEPKSAISIFMTNIECECTIMVLDCAGNQYLLQHLLDSPDTIQTSFFLTPNQN
jgi:hypothetical protein